ncbi:MAG: DUF501 domain-containing protein [Halanaerobiaceae bacterium]
MLEIGITENEKKVIEYQLGRNPENLKNIALYCPFQNPAVLRTIPYSIDYGIFPTMYWLSCPHLVREVSKLEDEGLVKKISRKLKNIPELQEEMKKAHQDYARKREELLTVKNRSKLKIKSEGMYKVIIESGVGGIIEKEGVKCLHTHLADFLVAGENPVGRMVWDLVEWPDKCEICNIDNI